MLGAHRVLLEAFETDVRPLLAPAAGIARRRGRPGRGLPAPAATPSASPPSAARRTSRAPTRRSDAVAHRALRHVHRRHGRSRRSGRRPSPVLERLGHEVVFPPGQTCCGQMHVNSGYRNEALALARRFVEVFGEYETVVSPSSSCVGTGARISTRSSRPSWRAIGAARLRAVGAARAAGSASTDVGASFPHRVTYHPTCHSLRVTRVGDAPHRLLAAVDGLELVPLPRRRGVLRLRRHVLAQERRHLDGDGRRQVRGDRLDRRGASAPRSTPRACCRSAGGLSREGRRVRTAASGGDPRGA